MLPDKDTEGSLSPLQRHFVGRLGRMLRLRSEQAGQLNEEGVRLIDRAIYSTYCDAVDLGVSNEAQSLLHKHAVPAGHDENPS
ncbi:MAG: hypothetical protein ABI559_07675 [Chloroflexota bacterium]